MFQAIALAIIGALAGAASSLVGRVLVALGMGYVIYTGLDTAMTYLNGQITSSIGGLPADLLVIFSIGKIGAAINLILSALTARWVIEGVTNGTLKKMVLK